MSPFREIPIECLENHDKRNAQLREKTWFLQTKVGLGIMKNRLIVAVLSFSLLPIFFLNSANASEVVSAKCKVQYKPGAALSLSFPRTSDRLATEGEQKHLIVAIDFADSKFSGNVNQLIESSLDPKRISDF